MATPSLVVVGAGRCGTQSAAVALGGEHEPNRDPTVYLAMARSHGWLNTLDCQRVLEDFDWPETIVDHKQSELIDATSGWGAEYVWLVRNPADSVASMCQKGWYKPTDDHYPPGYLKYYWRTTEGLATAKLMNDSGNRTRGDLTGDFSFAEWSQMTQAERCGWWWNYANMMIGVQLNRLKGRWKMVRIEDQSWPTENQSDAKPVTGFERYVKPMAEVLGY